MANRTFTGSRLVVRHLEFAYSASDARPVVDGWSEDFGVGTLTAMTGPSGSGKSTLLYLLGLVLRPGSGAIELDGQRVDCLPDAVRARLRAHRFGFVFQDAALDPSRTVLDNIVEGALYRHERRSVVLSQARELVERFEIAVPTNRKPGEISGGQAQRIALCRALLGKPDILLADEPTGNLDAASAEVVLGAFRDHASAGGCVVVATHDPGVAQRADRQIAIVKSQ